MNKNVLCTTTIATVQQIYQDISDVCVIYWMDKNTCFQDFKYE